ncbi:unnamed protein product [Bursaphelenchus okinawaensis]|uniref:C2H2-type domain-containing protein n=1 Tax=Bursaphelenchus okinawaensis TaxID=465554 RepID=A0A811LJ86_9BILA|nr:unnamed protein product [Bursaphelenchus okinawaensis]CAG9124223.1 unnamed protein product [Bursaphelenchus okinawaensis]
MPKEHVCRWEGCTFSSVILPVFKAHIWTHTGEARCRWWSCEQVFGPKEERNADHIIRDHTFIRDVFCNFCKKQFYSHVLRDAHERKIHVKKLDLFDCIYMDCHFASERAALMRDHIKYDHNDPTGFEEMLMAHEFHLMLPNCATPYERLWNEMPMLMIVKSEPDSLAFSVNQAIYKKEKIGSIEGSEERSESREGTSSRSRNKRQRARKEERSEPGEGEAKRQRREELERRQREKTPPVYIQAQYEPVIQYRTPAHSIPRVLRYTSLQFREIVRDRFFVGPHARAIPDVSRGNMTDPRLSNVAPHVKKK